MTLFEIRNFAEHSLSNPVIDETSGKSSSENIISYARTTQAEQQAMRQTQGII